MFISSILKIISSTIKTGFCAGVCICLLYQAAEAAPHIGDYFNHNTSKHATLKGKVTNNSATQANTTSAQWFETFDNAIATYKLPAADKVIMHRPFNQQEARILQWTKTAAKIARNYRDLANLLATIPIPSEVPGIAEYRNLTVDWYNDVAQVYEDLIRPCSPARTLEELDAALTEIHKRSHSLVHTQTTLQMMDSELRQQYSIHTAQHEDAIQQYVRHK